MRKILMSLVMLSTLLGFVGTGQAASLELGPFCFSVAPFTDIFVWFLNTDGGNQLIGSGQDLAGDRSQTVSGFIRSEVLHVGYTTHPQPGFVPVIAGGTIDLATGTGPGQCFSPDFVSCGDFSLPDTFASHFAIDT